MTDAPKYLRLIFRDTVHTPTHKYQPGTPVDIPRDLAESFLADGVADLVKEEPAKERTIKRRGEKR